MANKSFRKVNRPTGIAWLHTSKPIWINKYDAIEGVRAGFYQAYRAIEPVPAGRDPWTVDNRRMGDVNTGYPTLAAAMRAAA